jgi:hypothetical protein
MQVKLILGHPWSQRADVDLSSLNPLFADPDAIALFGVHDHDGLTYFNKEAFESFVAAWCAASCLMNGGDALAWRDRQRALVEAAARAGYALPPQLASR